MITVALKKWGVWDIRYLRIIRRSPRRPGTSFCIRAIKLYCSTEVIRGLIPVWAELKGIPILNYERFSVQERGKYRLLSALNNTKEKAQGKYLVLFWCGRQDLNLQGFPTDSKSVASAISPRPHIDMQKPHILVCTNIWGLMVGTTELESVTSCMSSKRSNQLSYAPMDNAYHTPIQSSCQAIPRRIIQIFQITAFFEFSCSMRQAFFLRSGRILRSSASSSSDKTPFSTGKAVALFG